MAPTLLARYAEDGSQKARRQMLAMGQSDPELLADVLGHLVKMASERAGGVSGLCGIFICCFCCIN